MGIRTALFAIGLSVTGVASVLVLPTPTPAASKGGSIQPERRLCGWIVNPTPANWSLIDRSGEWELGVQGGHQAKGLDTLPDLTEHDWEATNGASYGQGCACMTAQVDQRQRRIVSFNRFRQLPLRQCRSDRSLAK